MDHAEIVQPGPSYAKVFGFLAASALESAPEAKMDENPRAETELRLARFRALQSELIKTLGALNTFIEQTENELQLELELRFGPPVGSEPQLP